MSNLSTDAKVGESAKNNTEESSTNVATNVPDTTNEEKMCPICHETIETSTTIWPCRHEYCYTCIITFFASVGSYSAKHCPMYRGIVELLTYEKLKDGVLTCELEFIDTRTASDMVYGISLTEEESKARWNDFARKEIEAIKRKFLQQLLSQPKVKVSILEVAVTHYLDSTLQGDAAQPGIRYQLKSSDCLYLEELLRIRGVPERDNSDEEGRVRIVYRRLQHIKINLAYGFPRAADARRDL
ncbi:RING/U-box [Glarea lozoyensis ATCC 20868]|uniref:RING/U-box n=1 Tax=Glarea lozoyensis (strain ATCC 20868 / MF5171) TaxID=1116229 RepID=S3CKX2_GLAL2|nr:RING/U-box [Glarea lozoyensis ATCC 20868]EPE27172.1 RING/U-box [Glarea lozoyensis ATCC 20868]